MDHKPPKPFYEKLRKGDLVRFNDGDWRFSKKYAIFLFMKWSPKNYKEDWEGNWMYSFYIQGMGKQHFFEDTLKIRLDMIWSRDV